MCSDLILIKVERRGELLVIRIHPVQYYILSAMILIFLHMIMDNIKVKKELNGTVVMYANIVITAVLLYQN